MLAPGTVLSELEGVDIGSGAVVLSWENNIAKLYLKDQDKTIQVRFEKNPQYQVNDFDKLEFAPSIRDETVPDNSQNISDLPTS
jgi:hypothetical protein